MNVHPQPAPQPFPAAASHPRSAHADPRPRDHDPRERDPDKRDPDKRDPSKRDPSKRDPNDRDEEEIDHGSRQRRPERDEPPAPDDTPARRADRNRASALSLAVCGGIAAALFAFAPAPPASAAPPAGNADEADSAQPVTDTWITSKVKAELATTEGVHSLDISVTTVNGVVTLTGVQATDLAVKKAIAATKAVKGVKEVDAAGLKAKS